MIVIKIDWLIGLKKKHARFYTSQQLLFIYLVYLTFYMLFSNSLKWSIDLFIEKIVARNGLPWSSFDHTQVKQKWNSDSMWLSKWQYPELFKFLST